MVFNESGYIKLHRSILDWEWWDNPCTFRVFVYLLLTANWKKTRYQGLEIRRGQVLTSLTEIAKKTGISRQSVRTSLKHLQSTQEITQELTQYGSLITVENYAKYQVAPEKLTQQLTQHPTHDQHSPITHIEKDKEDKEIKESIKSVYINNLSNSIIDRLTDDEIDSLSSQMSNSDFLELIDRADEKLGKRLSEIKHPYQYVRTIAREMGFIGGNK